VFARVGAVGRIYGEKGGRASALKDPVTDLPILRACRVCGKSVYVRTERDRCPACGLALIPKITIEPQPSPEYSIRWRLQIDWSKSQDEP
jgi:rubredoxin